MPIHRLYHKYKVSYHKRGSPKEGRGSTIVKAKYSHDAKVRVESYSRVVDKIIDLGLTSSPVRR